jgi:exosome complex RNA-binding protein Csl4
VRVKPRTILSIAITDLGAEAKTCQRCGQQFVYGRKNATFCSQDCAHAAAQAAYRNRLGVSG